MTILFQICRLALLILLLEVAINPAVFAKTPVVNSFITGPEKTVLEILKQKPELRPALLKKQGKMGLLQLRKIAFADHHIIETRWKALMTLTMIAGPESLPDLELALRNSDWFMRDAGLKAMAKVAPEKAKIWAKKLMSDPALVVRSSAVQVIKNLKDQTATDLLWEKLYASNNFRGAQSLWVRRHIVETLSTFAKKGDEPKFIKVLADKDKSLHSSASMALTRITGLEPQRKDKSFRSDSEFWQSWWGKRKL